MTSFFWPAPPVDHPFHRMCPSEIFEMPSLGILLLLSGSLIFSHLPLYFRGPQPLYSVLISCHTTRSAISKLTTVHGLNPKLKLKPYVTNKEKAMATHSGILAWEIPWTEGPGGLWSMGSQRVRHDLVIKSEKELATHSSILAWIIPGTKEPGGLPSMGLHRVGHDWSDLAAAAIVMNNVSISHSKFPLAIYFTHGNVYICMPASQFPPSPSPAVFTSLFCDSIAPL